MKFALMEKKSVLPPTNAAALNKILALEEKLKAMPESKTFELQTEHHLHAGMYARTIRLAADTLVVGTLIKIPTMLIVEGDCGLLVDDKWFRVDGYHVFACAARRKQACWTIKPTQFTMIFPSDAKTVEEAEEQFTDETEKLLSRKQDGGDIFTVTGVEE